jgi:Kazal-type serine protease inhibitor domain
LPRRLATPYRVSPNLTPENSMTRLVLFLIVTFGLVVCAQAASRSRIILAQAAPPEVCAEIYQPVCGTNPAGMRVTYSNTCFARAAKTTNVTPRECAK